MRRGACVPHLALRAHDHDVRGRILRTVHAAAVAAAAAQQQTLAAHSVAQQAAMQRAQAFQQQQVAQVGCFGLDKSEMFLQCVMSIAKSFVSTHAHKSKPAEYPRRSSVFHRAV